MSGDTDTTVASWRSGLGTGLDPGRGQALWQLGPAGEGGAGGGGGVCVTERQTERRRERDLINLV